MKKLANISESEYKEFNDFNIMILEDFIANSTEFSSATKKAYESNLKIWFKWVKDNLGNKSQLEIKPLDYKRFQNWLLNRGCGSADVNNKRAAISSLNSYIEIYYHDDYPAFRNFINKSIKRPAKTFVHEKEPLTKNEFNHLINELTKQEEWQKIAYLEFTLSTGCRRAESRQLLKSVIDASPIVKKKSYVDDNGNTCEKEIKYYQTHPIRCKGKSDIGKVRKLSFSQRAMDAIKKWIEVRGEDDCEYVFITKYGGKIKQVGETTFNSWCANDFEKIVGRRIHPHLWRESAATQLVMEDGKNIESVRALLGHESSETTRIYVIRDEDEDLDDIF